MAARIYCVKPKWRPYFVALLAEGSSECMVAILETYDADDAEDKCYDDACEPGSAHNADDDTCVGTFGAFWFW